MQRHKQVTYDPDKSNSLAELLSDYRVPEYIAEQLMALVMVVNGAMHMKHEYMADWHIGIDTWVGLHGAGGSVVLYAEFDGTEIEIRRAWGTTSP